MAAIASLPMMMAGLAAAPAAIADEGTTTAQSQAQSQIQAAADAAPTPLASFDFDAQPTDGAFTSAGDTGATATVEGTAALVAGKDDASGTAAQLGSGFWLNVTGKDGALLKGLDNATISYDSKPNATGNTGWAVFAASDATKQEYGKEHYVGTLDKTTGLTVERYSNAGGRDSSGNLSATYANTGWKHVDIVLSGATARLYIDRKPVAVNTSGKTLSAILGANGGVLQVGKANWGNGEYFSGLIDNLDIYGEALTNAQLGIESTAKADYAAALAIPAKITGDLPSTVLGKTVTWKAEGDGASLVAADGKVTRPEAGKTAVKVKLTATIDGVDTPVTAESEILDNGGQIASYVKDVDRSDQNGAKYDPLAYNDDRRADSLYVASKAAGASTWETLNRSQSILSVKWDGSQSSKPNAQMGSPTFFRAKDGTLGAVSSQNNATGAIYVWDGTGDGATFANQRAITLSASSIVRDPRIEFDAAANAYKAFWTDALTGDGMVATLSDLNANATVGEATKADAPVMGVDDAAGLPAWAGEGQTSAFAVSAAEYKAFHDHYVDLTNTGVEPIADVTADNGADAAAIKQQVEGTKATMTYNDGSTKSFAVDWNADDLAAVDTTKDGTYEVKGTVKQVDEGMYNDARADPDIFYNPDDGYYYLTGSTYEVKSTDPAVAQKTSYRSIGLKRAKTISELKNAEEHIIIKPENGTPGHTDKYPNSFYGWSAFIWAQEFHKINGRWWIVAGFHKGASTTNGDWCNNTILIPYTGDEQSIKDGGFLVPENWGEPTVLEGAAFDVTYFEREETGTDGQKVTQGYWLEPTGNTLKVAKAKMGDGVVPLADGGWKQIYSINQIFEYGKRAPTPGDNTEGSDQGVVEAPFMFEYGDYVYILYAGGTVDKYYTTNMMRASLDADLQDPASWTQVDFPLLDTNDTYTGKYGADETSYERRHAGPGHISLVKDETDGNIVIAYHARPYPEIHSGSAAGGLMDQDRNTWVKAVNVRADGNLDLSLTKDQEVAPTNRTVTVKVVVGEPAPAPSSDASLKSLSVAGSAVSLDEAASADGASLEVADPAAVAVGDVAASASDEGASVKVAVADGVVTVTVTAADGTTTKAYVVKLVKKASPEPPAPSVPVFTDVVASTPHAADIQWLASEGISTGWKTGETTAVFSPMGPVVRQDMAAFLYRLAGSPAYEPSEADKARFTDVTPETPHYKEILWLASKGIAKGFANGDGTFSFGPMRDVVRQDMAAFLKNLADAQGVSPSLGEGVDFTDVNARTPHSAEISWLAQAGVTTGWQLPDGTSEFRGMNVVVRQDMAAFLHRMDTNVLGK